MDGQIIFSVIILILSVMIHEVSHGYAALYLGDVTAKYAGRLTLNPIKHIDPIGSIILPLVFVMMNAGIVLGWAKPVPYNPYNLRNQRWGELMVALAGPLANFILAIVFGLLVRFALPLGLPIMFVRLSVSVVLINLVLAIFNLIPIPPLDGSKILFTLLPMENVLKIRSVFERYGLFLVLFLAFFIWQLILPAVYFLAQVITGLN
ncbi:MAG TPA: site-2 protease family protein [Candidatus Paceibacterota bacterium]|nr:site-2 protease family protein [Candidatus Paceibacterota bacterium]HRZ34278.1 site-2 protease family protein [Candidatus Paceibacterota bacterium]